MDKYSNLGCTLWVYLVVRPHSRTGYFLVVLLLKYGSNMLKNTDSYLTLKLIKKIEEKYCHFIHLTKTFSRKIPFLQLISMKKS